MRRIRPSGGRIFVDVSRHVSSTGRIIERNAAADPGLYSWYKGPWHWRVPMPKNHPQPPSWNSLFGQARTMSEAVTAGRSRLRELYDPATVEGAREEQRAQSIRHQEYLDDFRARKAAGLATNPARV
jgi:hypothetical protein